MRLKVPALVAPLSIMPAVFFKLYSDKESAERPQRELDWYYDGLDVEETPVQDLTVLPATTPTDIIAAQKAQLADLQEKIGWIREVTPDFRSWVLGEFQYAPLPGEADSVCDPSEVLRILAHVLMVWQDSWNEPPCEQERQDAEWLKNALTKRLALRDFDHGSDAFEALVQQLLHQRKTLVPSQVYLAGHLLRFRHESDRCHEV